MSARTLRRLAMAIRTVVPALLAMLLTRRRSTARSRPRSPRACGSSGASFIRCSRPRTRRKAWPPSSRSARRSSSTN